MPFIVGALIVAFAISAHYAVVSGWVLVQSVAQSDEATNMFAVSATIAMASFVALVAIGDIDWGLVALAWVVVEATQLVNAKIWPRPVLAEQPD